MRVNMVWLGRRTVSFVERLVEVQSSNLNFQLKSHSCRKYKSIIPGPKSYCYVSSIRGDEHLKSLINHLGPVAISIYTEPKMQHLRGKFNVKCPLNVKANHAVLAVGWTRKYWIIRNSWGKEWGVDGYLYLKRGGNNCAVLSDASVPFY